MARYYRSNRSNSRAITNRYPTTCNYCGATVGVGEGKVWKFRGKWIGAHHKGDCDPSTRIQDADRVMVVRFSSGDEVLQNSHGRCEDAPCCGCCS